MNKQNSNTGVVKAMLEEFLELHNIKIISVGGYVGDPGELEFFYIDVMGYQYRCDGNTTRVFNNTTRIHYGGEFNTPDEFTIIRWLSSGPESDVTMPNYRKANIADPECLNRVLTFITTAWH